MILTGWINGIFTSMVLTVLTCGEFLEGIPIKPRLYFYLDYKKRQANYNGRFTINFNKVSPMRIIILKALFVKLSMQLFN